MSIPVSVVLLFLTCFFIVLILLTSSTSIKYVHLRGTKILIKAYFREEIDTSIKIYLADHKIIHPIEKSVISGGKGKN